MSADFLFASCPAPLAHITTTLPNNTSYTDLDIAPETVWAEPFHAWLEKTATINTILQNVEPYAMEGSYSWQEFILNRVDRSAHVDPLTDDEAFADYLTHLDETLHITDNEAHTNTYAQRVIHEITKFFLETAAAAFTDYVSQGTIHKWEYVTGGVSWGDAPTDHFDEVAALSWIDFFTDFPIAEITDGTITGWVDREGNAVTAPATL
mgnify:CR=1 FL=1